MAFCLFLFSGTETDQNKTNFLFMLFPVPRTMNTRVQTQMKKSACFRYHLVTTDFSRTSSLFSLAFFFFFSFLTLLNTTQQCRIFVVYYVNNVEMNPLSLSLSLFKISSLSQLIWSEMTAQGDNGFVVPSSTNK